MRNTRFAQIMKTLCPPDPNAERTEEPRYEIFSAETPLQPFNLEKYNGWRVIGEPSGLHDLAERQFTQSTNRFRDGVQNQATRLKERELTFRIEICGGDECKLEEFESELYRAIRCDNCAEVQCHAYTCLGGTCNTPIVSGCADDDKSGCGSTSTGCVLPTSSGCILRVKCCDSTLMAQVRLKSAKRVRKLGKKCAIYEIKFQQDDPRWFSDLQRVVIRPSADNLTPQGCFQGVISCNNCVWDTCITVPYFGDIVGLPRVYMAGAMVNPTITNTSTGAVISLSNDGAFILPSCKSVLLTFWEGEQLYQDVFGNNLLPLLGSSCLKFNLDSCNTQLCINAEQVDPTRAVIIIEYFNYFESFSSGASALQGCP